MHRVISSIALGLCLAATQFGQAQDLTILPGDDPSTALISNETANNTSACLAPGNPSYCSKALPDLRTTGANQSAGADTIVTDSLPEHVSTISVKRLMYPKWNGSLICQYEPWFGDTVNHKDIGYSENDLTVVNYQDTVMHNRGCDINFIAFYGLKGDLFNRTTADTVYQDLFQRPTFPLKMGILEDDGAYKYFCNPLTVSCIEGVLEADMGYIDAHYAAHSPNPNLYWQDGGTNVVGFFGGCVAPLNCPGDWETIWSAVQNYVNSQNPPYNMKFVFEYGSFNSPLGVYDPGNFNSPQISQGAYAWPQPYTGNNCTKNNPPNCFVSNPPSQDYWCDANGITCTGKPDSGAYLDRFYADGKNSGKITIGLLYAGFDDSNASWGLDRVISQRCGHTLLDTANEVTKGGYWGKNSQIPYMQLATWNDYEEGTETESGVDNCYWTVTLTLPPNSTTISWTLGTQNDPNNEATSDPGHHYYDSIHHYVVWTAPPGGTNLSKGAQPPATATQYDLTKLGLKSGTTVDVYLEMVGQPSMQNEMSDKVTYTQK